jgi:hypothetical protein
VAIITLLLDILIMVTINDDDIVEGSINCGFNDHAPPCCHLPIMDKGCLEGDNLSDHNQTNSSKSNLP